MPELTTSGASARTRVGCANLCSGIKKRLCSDWWPGTKMDGVQTRQCSEPSIFTNDQEKVFTIVKSAAHLELGYVHNGATPVTGIKSERGLSLW